MMEHDKTGWNSNLNLDNAKKPLKDINTALKLIRKDYEKKYKELIRLKKGMNGDTTM